MLKYQSSYIGSTSVGICYIGLRVLNFGFLRLPATKEGWFVTTSNSVARSVGGLFFCIVRVYVC